MRVEPVSTQLGPARAAFPALALEHDAGGIGCMSHLVPLIFGDDAIVAPGSSGFHPVTFFWSACS